jgi:hypothetical protein
MDQPRGGPSGTSLGFGGDTTWKRMNLADILSKHNDDAAARRGEAPFW